MKPNPKKSTKSKRPRGRPPKNIIERIEASPEEIAKAIFRVAKQELDRRVRGASPNPYCLGLYISPLKNG